MLDVLIYGVFFFIIPAILIALFTFALYRFVSAKKKNKAAPGTFTEREIKKRKIIMIISAVIAGAFLTIVIGLCALLYMAVAYM